MCFKLNNVVPIINTQSFSENGRLEEGLTFDSSLHLQGINPPGNFFEESNHTHKTSVITLDSKHIAATKYNQVPPLMGGEVSKARL